MTHLAAWRAFMRLHVYAVWDFMSLLKRLQSELMPATLPWQPGPGGEAARFIQEIVLAEECDADGRGSYCSHFELYRRAMAEAGADLAPIEGTLAALRQGVDIDEALARAPIPAPVRAFVGHTLQLAQAGTLAQVAAAFLYGREAMLPGLFADLLAAVGHGEPRLATLARYFARHIEVDGEEHGPMASRLLASVCGDDPLAWQEAYASAAQSLALREALWEAIHQQVLGAAREDD